MTRWVILASSRPDADPASLDAWLAGVSSSDSNDMRAPVVAVAAIVIVEVPEGTAI